MKMFQHCVWHQEPPITLWKKWTVECSEATSNRMWSTVTQHKKLLLWESAHSRTVWAYLPNVFDPDWGKITKTWCMKHKAWAAEELCNFFFFIMIQQRWLSTSSTWSPSFDLPSRIKLAVLCFFKVKKSYWKTANSLWSIASVLQAL